ncbi:MAG: sigma factor-like helix-turn-helix DNA-binding protein, partial [Coraliomargarita sp.]
FWKVFETCINDVKDPARQAFILKVLEDQTTEEVCKVMDITPNYLWVLLHRARAQLKTALEAKWTGPEAD